MWALPLGIAGGIGIAVAMFLVGNRDPQAANTATEFWAMLGLGALAGCALVLAALIGGTVLVLIGDRNRHRKHELEVWVTGGTMGAVAGVIVLWLALAIVNRLTSLEDIASLFFYVIFAAFTAGLVGYGANVLLKMSQARLVPKSAIRQKRPRTQFPGRGFPQ